MEVMFPINRRILTYLKRHGIERAFEKQLLLFKHNPYHPSLHTEILEPKYLRIYSFRITRQYRAIFVYCGDQKIEIVDVNNHYA